MRDVETVLVVLVVFAAVVSNLYAFFYMFRPWWKNPQGRALMVKSWGNVVVLNMAAAFALFGDYPGRHGVRIAGFSLFIVGITYLLWALLFSPGARSFPPWSWLDRYRRAEP